MVNYSGSYAAPRMDLGEAFMEYGLEESGFIGKQILPIFRTPKKEASFSAHTRETLTQDSDAKRAAKSGYNRVNIGATDKSYKCHEYGLEGVVDDAEKALYLSDFDAEMATNETIARALWLQYEKRVNTLIFDTAVWTGAALFTDNSAAPWDAAASDAIGHVRAAKEKVRVGTGMRPNALILSEVQKNNLLANTAIIARFPGAAVVTEEMLRAQLGAIFGLQKLIVGGGVRDSAIEGQAFSGADVWSDDYAMVARLCNENDPLSTPCLGRSMLWVADSPTDVVAEMYREEQTRGDVLRVRQNIDELLIDSAFGHLMQVDA